MKMGKTHCLNQSLLELSDLEKTFFYYLPPPPPIFLVHCPFMFFVMLNRGGMVLGILAYVRPNSPNIWIVRKRRGSKKSCEELLYLTRSQESGLIAWLCNSIFILYQCGSVKLLYSVKELRRFESTCWSCSGRRQNSTSIYSFVVQDGFCLLLLSTMSSTLTLENVPFFR